MVIPPQPESGPGGAAPGRSKTIGHYRLLSKLGEGGMGEVWRATDTKLNREVAIKLLPEAVAGDAMRLGRFAREAQVLASLNHPGIAAIYGVEERALVMELVEGETLAERIRSGGAMGLEEALPIARQIAEALAYAHDKGVIHRDLKPANVKITPEGAVKILDFGLAKAMSTESSASGTGLDAPTISAPATTLAGTVLGTAAYMAPEQARGQHVDRRADIWAYGVGLYEMLAGERPFGGPTVSDTLAAVLKETPDFEKIPAAARRLAQHCLEKDPRRRLRDIGDAMLLLTAGAAAAATAATPASPLRRMLPWAVAGLLAAGLLMVLAIWKFAAAAPQASPVLAYIPPPPKTTFRDAGFGAGPVVISPDGKELAFSATDENGVTRLYVRSLGSDQARAIAGTQDAAAPFWSPNEHSLGFFADQKLKTVNLESGNVQILADASCSNLSGAWSPSGTILFTPGCNGGLEAIASTGSNARTPVPIKSGQSGQVEPSFLLDGRRILYTVYNGHGGTSIWMGPLDASDQKFILKDARLPEFAAGDLLFIRNGRVFAQPFNPARESLSGTAVALTEAHAYSASSAGVIAFQGGTVEGHMEWYDRNGNPQGSLGPVARFISVRISPDGKKILANIQNQQSHSSDLWSFPAGGGVGTRLTYGPGYKGFSVWSPGGKYIVYSCHTTTIAAICRKPANGSGAGQRLVTLGGGLYESPVLDVSPDRRYLSVNELPIKNLIYKNVVIPLFGKERPFRPAPVKASQYDGLFSPDGRWLAYFSYESGRPEDYVVPFPGPGGKFQISQNGGWACKWDKQGRLYFLSMGNRLMEAELGFSGGAVQVKSLQPLFQVSLPSFSDPIFDVNADGSRFVFVTSVDPTAAQSIGLLLNWQAKFSGQP